MKVLINRLPGGFCLSRKVYEEIGIEWDVYGYLNNEKMGIDSENEYQYRADPRLIAAVEKLGYYESAGPCATLSILRIEDDVSFEIVEQNGKEWVMWIDCLGNFISME